MIVSPFILDIFDLAFDDLSSGDLLRKQIAFLSPGEKEHTTVGLFTYFVAARGIEQFRVPTDNITNFDVQGNPIDRINGVEIRNEELNILADASVQIKNGFINCAQPHQSLASK